MPDSPHLTPVELVSFWDREVEDARVIEILSHLARGCPACLPLAAELPWPLPIASPAIAEGQRAGALARMQDFRIRAAFKKVLAANAALDAAQDRAAAEVGDEADLGELSRLPPPTQTLLLARADAWLWKARTLRRKDPEKCLFAAVLAVSFADALDSPQHPAGEAENLQAEAWAELANARRLDGDLQSAEAALFRAVQSTSDVCVAAEVGEVVARYLLATRQFEDADALLSYLQQIYLQSGESHSAGRVCMRRGSIAKQQQDLLLAVRFHLDCLKLLDLSAEPALSLAAFHNVIDCSARLGFFDTAREWLDRCLPLYEAWGGETDLLRRRWVEGNVEAGLGNLPRADALLRQVREAFEDLDLSFEASLVTLDLCAVWLRRGKFREVVCGVDEAVCTFQALKIRREALAGLLLLQEAARAEQATLAMVQSAAVALRAEGG